MGFGKSLKKLAKRVERAVSSGAEDIFGKVGYDIAKGALKTVTGLSVAEAAKEGSFRPMVEAGGDMFGGTNVIGTGSRDLGELNEPVLVDPIPELQAYAANLAMRRRRRTKGDTYNTAETELINILGGSGTLGV